VKNVTRCFWLNIPALFLPAGNLWASEGGGRFPVDILWQIIAFIFLAGFLAKILKKPTLAFLSKRKEEIRDSLAQAKKKENEAQRLFEEWEKKLALMGQEIRELHESLKREGETERERIVERAQEEGDRIQKQAQIIAGQEVKKAQASLRKEMVDLSVEWAEGLLKKNMQPRDQERLVKEYLGRMKEIQ
jgi:F-type H+-transporting ATPase subunit b